MEIEDILTVGEEIHEGWNDYDLYTVADDGTLLVDRYSYYRLYNARNAGCDDIGEVQLIGIQVI